MASAIATTPPAPALRTALGPRARSAPPPPASGEFDEQLKRATAEVAGEQQTAAPGSQQAVGPGPQQAEAEPAPAEEDSAGSDEPSGDSVAKQSAPGEAALLAAVQVTPQPIPVQNAADQATEPAAEDHALAAPVIVEANVKRPAELETDEPEEAGEALEEQDTESIVTVAWPHQAAEDVEPADPAAPVTETQATPEPAGASAVVPAPAPVQRAAAQEVPQGQEPLAADADQPAPVEMPLKQQEPEMPPELAATEAPRAVPPAGAGGDEPTADSALDAIDDLPTPVAAPAPADGPPAKPGDLPAAVPPDTPELRFVEENHPKIVTAIRGDLGRNGGSMMIRLDPPGLGEVQVTVELRDGAMIASIQTSNDDATRLMSHSLGQLKRSLESSGLSVEKLQVQQAPRQEPEGNADGGRGGWQQQGDGRSAQQEQQRREILARVWRRLRGGRDPIDLMA